MLSKYSLKMTALYWCVTSILWCLVNNNFFHYSFTIPHLSIDAKIPVYPLSSLLYASYYFVMIAFIMTYSKAPFFKKVFYMTLLGVVITLSINFFLPTQLDAIPNREIIGGHGVIYNLIKSADHGYGCAPCGHVFLPMLLSIYLWREQKRIGALVFLVWAILLGVSTLTMGQHYLFDLGLGFLWAIIFSYIPFAKTLIPVFVEWLVVAICLALAWESYQNHHYLLLLVFYVIIATRQHAMMVLFHEGVHCHLYKQSKKINDAITRCLLGVPLLIPLAIFRRIHLKHHANLGTEKDPEKTILYANQVWQYKALPLKTFLMQLLADLFFYNGIKSLIALKQHHYQL